jgi:Xaa-Pro aminopeptidase
MPHAELTDREIQNGDLVTIDFGVSVGGYASDLTRTLLPAQPNQKQKYIFDSVLRAQAAGLIAARAGIACKELDAICRDLIRKDGYGDFFIHTTGHGIGREVHENPRIGINSEEYLEAGMVVTIEPGIYIEGFGGVRIEDTVIITKTGNKVITGRVEKNLYY